jgi:lysophospholipase L1-like esterase
MKRRILPLLLSLVLGLSLAEVLVRLLLDPPEHATVSAIEEADERRSGEGLEDEELRANPWSGRLMVHTPAGVRLRASTRAVIRDHRTSGRDVSIRTNSLGYRNPELGPRTRTRVLFLGDSITLAHYLPEEESFVRLVQDLSEGAGAPLETVNAGVAAIGLENELAILVETGLSTEPDVVVLGFYLNDVHPSPGVAVPRVPAYLAFSHVARHVVHRWPALVEPAASEPVPGSLDPEEAAAAADLRRRREEVLHAAGVEPWQAELQRWESIADRIEPWRAEVLRRYPPSEGDPLKGRGAFHQAIQDAFLDWGSAWSEDAWESMTPVLRELARQAEAHDFQLLFLCFPVRLQVEAEPLVDEPQRRFARIAAELGVPLLDLLPPLRAAHREGGGELFYDQCHHTPRGSRLVAELVHAFVQEHRGP